MTQVISNSAVVDELATVPGSVVDHAKALIMGPNYQTVRYSSATEKALGSLGDYDYTQDTCYAWPNLESGAVVDLSATRLFMDDAWLQYFNEPAGSGDTIKATFCQSLDLFQDSEVKNAIRGLTTNWKTSGVYARNASLFERDVQVGDAVRVSAVVDSVEVILLSTIASFMNEKVAGIVGAASEDPNNISYDFDGSASSSSTSPAVGFLTVSGSVDLSAAAVTNSDRPEHAYELGVVEDVYSITVTTAGVVGVGSPKITIVSASGTDDEASVDVVAGDAITPFGVKGMSVTIPDASALTTDMEWEVTIQFGVADVDVTSGGSYTGSVDTTYVVEVTTGASFAGGPPEVTVTTTTGVDSSGPTEVSGLATAIAVGSFGVTIQFTSLLVADQGLYLGDKFYITVTAAAAGAVRTLVLNHNLPNELLGLSDADVCGTPPDLSVTLYILKDIEVTEDRAGFAPLVNWEADEDEFCVSDGIVAYDSTWVDGTGDTLPMPVISGDMYVQYRALKVTSANVIGRVSTESTTASEIKTEVEALLGPAITTNPLSLGVYLALLNAGIEEVLYIGVDEDAAAGYTSALNWAAATDEAYTVVPLTFNATIQGLVKTHVDALSQDADGQWRSMIVSTVGVSESGIVTADEAGSSALATVKDDPGSGGLQYTLVESPSDVNFVTAGVREDDVLRTQYTTDGFGVTTYSEYVVDSVSSADSLLLKSGPTSAITEAAKFEIWRTLDAQGIADALVAAVTFDDVHVLNVWPDRVVSEGVTVSGYYLACVLAGARSTTVPHRTLTNIELLGVDSVDRTSGLLTPTQRDELEAAGILVVDALVDGTVYTRRAVTTDTTDLFNTEEVMTRNADNVRYSLADAVAPFKGQSNLIDSTISQIRTELRSAIDFLLSRTQVTNLGSQITAAGALVVERHPTLLNRLIVTQTVSLPYPFGELEIILIIE